MSKTYEDVMKQIEQMQTQLQVLEQESNTLFDLERQAALSQVNSLIAKYKLENSQIQRGIGPKKSKTPKSAPMYRHPTDPTKTWTGKGKVPKWMKEYEAAGGKRADRLIRPSSQTVASPEAERLVALH